MSIESFASIIFVALFGAIIGSFLNALSFRIHTGQSIVFGRSHCMRCGHVLSAFNLIPIFSYLLLGGKCQYCKVQISPQYPLVEFGAALIAVGIYLTVVSPYAFIYWFIVWMILLFITVYDLRHTIIPPLCSVTLIILVLSHFIIVSTSLVGLLAGPVLAAPLLLLSLFSKGKWMGWGDGFLELSLGWFLGMWGGLTALVFGFWIGALVGLYLLFASHRWKGSRSRFTMKSEIPLAPFLILGAAVVYFFHVDIFSSIPNLFF